jgi:hypothetical protein
MQWQARSGGSCKVWRWQQGPGVAARSEGAGGAGWRALCAALYAGDAGGDMLCAVLHAGGCGGSPLLQEVLDVLVREGRASASGR